MIKHAARMINHVASMFYHTANMNMWLACLPHC